MYAIRSYYGFVEDDWENPTLGAWGLGWEVWMNGMEVTQFTYFQQVGGIDCKPITGETTYGIERLAMYLQGVENVYDLTWTEGLTYGDVYHQNEVEQSRITSYNVCYTKLLRGQRRFFTQNGKAFVTPANGHVKTGFDLPDVFIQRPAQIGELVVVDRCQRKVDRLALRRRPNLRNNFV